MRVRPRRKFSAILALLLIFSMLQPATFAAKPVASALELGDDWPETIESGKTYTFHINVEDRGVENPNWGITSNGDIQAQYVTYTIPRPYKTVIGEFTFTANGNGSLDVTYFSENITTPLSLNIPVEVVASNNDPYFIGDYAFTDVSEMGTEDTLFSFTPDASDPDGNPLTYGIEESPTLDEGTLNFNNGQYHYMPAENFNGTADFFISVDDGQGGKATQYVEVWIDPVNDDPVIEGSYDFSVQTDGVHSFEIIATDVDGDTLTYSETSSNADITGNVVTYTAGSTAGSETFDIEVYDGTVTVSMPVTATIESIPVNNDPYFIGDYTFTDVAEMGTEDTLFSFTPTADDADGDPLTYGIEEAPTVEEGTLNFNNGQYHYMPAENFNGTADFFIFVEDGQGGKATQYVEVWIDPVNDDPVIEGSYDFTVETDGVHTFEIVATDVDGDLLTYSETSPNAETLGNVVTYTAGSTAGSETFDIVVYDGTVHISKEVIVTITDAQQIYVALGDSIPYGKYYTSLWDYLGGGTDTNSYVEQLADNLGIESNNFYDKSVSGYNANEVYTQIDTISDLIGDADIITLCVGANDIMDAASRGFGGLNKYDINWETAKTGRKNFETYWWQIIDKIEELNPDVTLVVMTIYNPYHEYDSYYDQVDPYFSSSADDFRGLNYIINNTETLYDEYLVDTFDYRVVDIYSAFNDFHHIDKNYGVNVTYDSTKEDEKDYLTRFYGYSFCDPHPVQYGQDLIHNLHYNAFFPGTY